MNHQVAYLRSLIAALSFLLVLFGLASCATGSGAAGAAAAKGGPQSATGIDAVSAALAAGDSSQALANYQKLQLTAAEQAKPESGLILANLYLSNGQLAEAAKAFGAVLASLPKAKPMAAGEAKSLEADAHYGLYLVALNRGQAAEAKNQLDLTIAAQPDHAGALLALAQIDLANKNYPRALERFDRSLELEPGNPVALQGKASLLARTDRVEEAVALLGQVMAKEPGNLLALAERGKLYGQLERWELALADLDALVAQEPGNYFNYLDRGRVLSRAGRGEAAIADFSKVLELEPGANLALVYRGQVNWQLQRLPEARRDLEAVAALRPGYMPALEPLSLIAWKQGRWTDAARLFEQQYDERLKNARTLALAVAALHQSGDKAATKQLAEKFLAKLDEDSPFRAALRLMVDPASEVFALEQETKIKQAALKPSYKLVVSLALLKQGRKQTGINWLKDVIDSVPADSPDGRLAAWMMDEYQR